MEHKLEILLTLAGAVAMLTANEQAQVFGACTVGSVMMGFVGAVYFPGKAAAPRQTIRNRWAANLCTGICGGPFLALHMARYFPDQPPAFLAILSGGMLGMAGVLVLTMLIPYAIQWLISFLETRGKGGKDG